MAEGGRPPKGPALVESLEGTAEAKERLRVALETIAGTKSIAEACEELEVKEATLYELRARALQAALEAVESKPIGRPRKESAVDSKVEGLEREIVELRRKLSTAELRVELHAALPELAKRVKDSGKKTKEGPEKR